MFPNLEYLIPFFGSFDELLPFIKCSYGILSADLETVIKPNIALLRQCGLSDHAIAKLSSAAPWVLSFNPKRVKEFLLRADELGVPRSSRMFSYAVAAVVSLSQRKLVAKMEFCRRTLGCSEADLAAAVQKQPCLLTLSEENFQFLINEVGFEPQYLVERPTILMFSLERRLVPRHYVMKALQAKGLVNKCSLFSVAHLGKEAFKSRFIDSHKDSVPEFGDDYAAACAGEVPSLVQL